MCSLPSVCCARTCPGTDINIISKVKGLNLSITLVPDFIDLYTAKLLILGNLAGTITERWRTEKSICFKRIGV